MRRLQLMSVTGFCAVMFLLAFQLDAFLLHETAKAFPTIATVVPYILSPFRNQQNQQASLVLYSTTSPTLKIPTNATANASYPIRYDPKLVRYRCRIAYDGTSFAGFQLQGGRTPKTVTEEDLGKLNKHQRKQKFQQQSNNPRTIQGEIESVLTKRFQRLVKVVGAGRTDGGVHARGQAIHFDLFPNETTAEDFEQALELTLDRMLPSDIRAWNVNRAEAQLVLDTGSEFTPPGYYNWNAMRSCKGKLYSYRICVGDSMNPIDRYHRWQLPWQGLDPKTLERILHKFEGERDFVCFAGALEQQEKKSGIALGTVRTIQKINLVHECNANNRDNNNNMGGDPSQDYYRIDIYLDGALYKMVRNIVNTAIDTARGWLDEETLDKLLNQPAELNYSRKDNPCKPAPANGLTLERVFYPDDF